MKGFIRRAVENGVLEPITVMDEEGREIRAYQPAPKYERWFGRPPRCACCGCEFRAAKANCWDCTEDHHWRTPK